VNDARIVEAILFASDAPLSPGDLAQLEGVAGIVVFRLERGQRRLHAVLVQ